MYTEKQLKIFSGNSNRPLADEICDYLKIPNISSYHWNIHNEVLTLNNRRNWRNFDIHKTGIIDKRVSWDEAVFVPRKAVTYS